MGQTGEVGVVAHVRQRLLHQSRGIVVDEDALDRAAVSDVFENFIDEQLPLRIGIARMNDAIRLPEQTGDDGELLLRFRERPLPPRDEEEREIRERPFFEGEVVVLRLAEFKHMAEAPCHAIRAAFVVSAPFLPAAEGFDNRPREFGLFRDVEHCVCSSFMFAFHHVHTGTSTSTICCVSCTPK